MGKPGLKKVHRYSTEFKLTAVKLSHMPGVEVQTVASALDIHPFMLSRWRKREHAMLKAEHELLKNAIRFSSARRRRSSSSSTASGNGSR